MASKPKAATPRTVPRLLEWIDARDAMPDDDTTVLVSVEGLDEPVWLGWFDGNRWALIDGCELDEGVTHWAPLPEPALSSGNSGKTHGPAR